MPLIALVALGLVFGGVVYVNDDRPEIRRLAKLGIVAGAVGVTLVAMSAFGPVVALCLFAAFVAASFLMKFWS